MAKLVDGGDRTTFNGGAIREIVEGKGRCDLLPLKQIVELFGADSTYPTYIPCILRLLDSYIRSGKKEHLHKVINIFINEIYKDPFTAMLELSKHYEDGANKYSDRNWENGLPLHSLLSSGIRHFFKFLRGDTDEPHDRAFMWNVIGAIWTQENHPECIDLPFNESVITGRVSEVKDCKTCRYGSKMSTCTNPKPCIDYSQYIPKARASCSGCAYNIDGACQSLESHLCTAETNYAKYIPKDGGNTDG